MLIAELCDWSRFKNRKQIGSYTGLCGGVLRGQAERQDEPRLRLALSGATMAEDPLEDVADPHAL